MFLKGKWMPLMLLVLALTLSACAPATPVPVTETAAVPAPTVTVAPTATAEPLVFTDNLGQEIILDAPAQRIVSLAPSITESLFAIGAGGQIVGRTDFDNYPEEVADIPSVGGVATLSLEDILALQPDVVIGGSTYQAETIQALTEAGVIAFVIEPETLDEILEQIVLLGAVSGHAEAADALRADLQARIDAVAAATESIPPEDRPTVFYEIWDEPLMTVSARSFIGEVIETAGGVNIFADLPDAYPMISAEEVIAADPDFIVGPSSHGDKLTADSIAAREGWENLRAVQDGYIYIVDGDMISRQGPRIVDVLEELAQVFQPVAVEH